MATGVGINRATLRSDILSKRDENLIRRVTQLTKTGNCAVSFTVIATSGGRWLLIVDDSGIVEDLGE